MPALPPNSLIAAGPVIIEDGKVLLNKHGDDAFWKFPGGRVEDFDISLEETARREVKEEMGLDVELIRPVKPMLVKLPKDGVVILIHYLARRLNEVKPGPDIREWGWHPINDLPNDLAPNIRPVLDSLKNS